MKSSSKTNALFRLPQNGRTPLHYAALTGNARTYRQLVDLGAATTVQDTVSSEQLVNFGRRVIRLSHREGEFIKDNLSLTSPFPSECSNSLHPPVSWLSSLVLTNSSGRVSGLTSFYIRIDCFVAIFVGCFVVFSLSLSPSLYPFLGFISDCSFIHSRFERKPIDTSIVMATSGLLFGREETQTFVRQCSLEKNL